MADSADFRGTVDGSATIPVVHVLCVTKDARVSSLVWDELKSATPNFRFGTVPGVEEVLLRFVGQPEPEAVLVGPDVPEKDALRLTTAIRRRSWPVAVILLQGSSQCDPPLTALEAGADDWVVPGAARAGELYEVLQRAIDRHREDAERRLKPISVLVIGDYKSKERHLGYLPYFNLVAGGLGPDGRLEGIPTGPDTEASCDLVLMDDVISMPRVLLALKDLQMRAPDVPVVLLVDPECGDYAVQAYKLGAAECIVKAGNHYRRLAPVLRNLVHLRDVFRERRDLRSTGTRLRMLVEIVPASITVLTRTGVFMALNQAGLPLLGARSPEQVVGRCLGALVPQEQEPSVSSFLEGVCAGGRGTIQIDCRGVDGTVRRLELRAVPLRRDPEKLVTVLATLREVPEDSGTQPHAERDVEKALRADLAATTEALKAAEARLDLFGEEWRKEKESAERAFQDLEVRLRLAEARQLEVGEEFGRARESPGQVD